MSCVPKLVDIDKVTNFVLGFENLIYFLLASWETRWHFGMSSALGSEPTEGPQFKIRFFFVFILLWDCSLCWDHWNGTWRLHLTRHCTLGQVQFWVEHGIGLRSFVNWVSSFPSRAQCFSKASEGGCVEYPSLQFRDEVVRGVIYAILCVCISMPRGERIFIPIHRK